MKRRGPAERLPRNARNTNKLNGLKYVRGSRVSQSFAPKSRRAGLSIEGGHQTRLSRVGEGQQPIINGCKGQRFTPKQYGAYARKGRSPSSGPLALLARGGDRHFYASRTRFVPEKLLGLFERINRLLASAPGLSARAPGQAPRIEIGARVRGMWH